MRNGFVLGGFLISFIIILLIANPVEADSKVYYGQVVGIEFTVIQVRGGVMAEFPSFGWAIKPTWIPGPSFLEIE